MLRQFRRIRRDIAQQEMSGATTSADCILNDVYSGPEGRGTGRLEGPMPSGEIACQTAGCLKAGRIH